MKVGVVGLGKLGLPFALVLAKWGLTVNGVDIFLKRLQQIKSNDSTFEPQVNELLNRFPLDVSSSYESLKNCEVVFVLVQTPALPSGLFDLRFVESAVKQIHKANPHCLIVVSSTLNVGDTHKLQKIHKRLVYNPPLIRQGQEVYDFEHPKFLLIGADQQGDSQIVEDVWRRVHNRKATVISSVEAEISKLALNMNLTLTITYANAIGELCERFKADPNTVLGIVYKDRRNYLPGLGFGGPCLPRDVRSFKAVCSDEKAEIGMTLADVIDTINENCVVDKYVCELQGFGKQKIGFAGLAYKPDVPYLAESCVVKIIEKLQIGGFEILVFDPLIMEADLPRWTFCSSIEELLKKAEVLFVGIQNFGFIEGLTVKPCVNPWRAKV